MIGVSLYLRLSQGPLLVLKLVSLVLSIWVQRSQSAVTCASGRKSLGKGQSLGLISVGSLSLIITKELTSEISKDRLAQLLYVDLD